MRFDMTKSLKELSQRSLDEIKAGIVTSLDTERLIEDAAYAINANADFYYNLGADTQLEAVGEDDLDAHMQAPIFAQLTLESQEYLRDDEVTDIVESGWDRAEDRVASTVRAVVTYGWAVVLGLALAGIGWLELVSAA